MDIKKTFLELTKYTYPYGTEMYLEPYLPVDIKKDKFDNYFLKIGESRTMFACHLDTACSDFTSVNQFEYYDYITTDGKTILGADDKAGVCVMLNLIENNVPGLYYFFIGEEVGCIGSNSAAYEFEFTQYDRCISFDRRGYSSVITHQLMGRCCSDNFAEKLVSEFNKSDMEFKLDDTGIMTDSASFMSKIPECTNISVGYFNEHTVNEIQNIVFLKKLCDACVIIDWESLPTERDMNESYYDYQDDINEDAAELQVKIGKKRFIVTIKTKRLEEEKEFICEFLQRNGSYNGFKSVSWDGMSCYVLYQDIDSGFYSEYLGERDELVHVVDRLLDLPVADLNILQELAQLS